jgi:hypothetical protein
MNSKIDWNKITWICLPCGTQHGKRVPRMATWHWGHCDVCGKKTAVTEPRDFGITKEIKHERTSLPHSSN